MRTMRCDGSSAGALDARERQVMKMLARGLTNSEAARELHLPPRTVSAVSRAVRDKFDAVRPADLWQATLECLLARE